MSTFNVQRTIAVLTAVGALLLSALAVAPLAEAQTLHACVKKKGGAVRIVGAKTKCKKGESKISWNTTGPAGATGLPGALGATGAAGAIGPMGPGAIKGSLFEAPKTGDPEHKVLESGPLRLGVSCQSTSTPEQIRFILYVSVPEVPTTLAVQGQFVTVSKPLSAPEEATFEPGEHEEIADFIFVTGPNGVPELAFIAYGARTEEVVITPETTSPRGCWLQAEEL